MARALGGFSLAGSDRGQLLSRRFRRGGQPIQNALGDANHRGQQFKFGQLFGNVVGATVGAFGALVVCSGMCR
ncbi:hypothetical protein C3Z06_03410 [Cupriavidus metallidurans]|nr:hypothetical protein C3Z06_03410 [Cupriavidus metallidurans]